MANMTRQHFQFIAEVLGSLENDMDMQRSDMREITWLFADALRATNSAFDSGRFFKAVEAHRLALKDEGHMAPAEGDANFEKLRLDNKYDGVPADTGTHE